MPQPLPQKKTGQITVHLSDGVELAVKNIAYAEDMKPSEWVRCLIEEHLLGIYVQSKNTMDAISHLENDEIFQNFASE